MAAGLIAIAGGCALVDESQLTESIAVPTADPALARDAYVAMIYHLAKAGQEAQLVARLDRDRAAALASPVPGVTPSAYPDLPTAPPTATPTPSPPPPSPASASASAPLAAVASPTAGPSATPVAPSPSPPGSPSPTPTPRIPVDPALALALFKVDPGTYRRLFVENYPIDEAGVRADYGDRLARARLTKDGTRFPIAAIARFAGGGDPVAVLRLLAATASSSGSLAGPYADADAYVAAKNPDGFLAGLQALPMGIRLRVASTSHWCLIVPKAVLAQKTDDPQRVAMIGVIRSATAACAQPRPVHRRRAGKPAPHGHAKPRKARHSSP